MVNIFKLWAVDSSRSPGCAKNVKQVDHTSAWSHTVMMSTCGVTPRPQLLSVTLAAGVAQRNHLKYIITIIWRHNKSYVWTVPTLSQFKSQLKTFFVCPGFPAVVSSALSEKRCVCVWLLNVGGCTWIGRGVPVEGESMRNLGKSIDFIFYFLYLNAHYRVVSRFIGVHLNMVCMSECACTQHTVAHCILS